MHPDAERARWAAVKAIVEAAMLLPREDRAAYLQTEVPDADLRREAEQLLAFDRGTTGLFPIGSWQRATAASLEEELGVGSELGNYRIAEEIGRGGMGAVYLARRADGAYEQAVALKVLQEGIRTAEMERRFRGERQILAGLTHPGIARMLDGGITSTGRPYLVMEYIQGQPIDRFCDEQALDLRARLRLFLKLAEAVQAAHQQLVLHLDLKPANILITPEGEPRLLDFGIARLVQENESVVQPSVMMMTPRYASPEQAAGRALGVGSDVFSLSTLLYLLLTGALPYPLGEANAFEAARMIREQAPMPPAEAAGGERGAALRGDLEAILLKGLRKEPERRYPTVEAMSADITRYLENRPVLARKDSFSYRASKFMQRNRAPLAAAAVVLVVLAGSIAAVVHSAVVARQQRAAAERRLQDIQQLARFYVDELFPALTDIPGTLPVRKKMTENAVKYLQSMSTERSGDPAFSKDLASGFFSMAMVQGFPNEPSLGDLGGSLRLFGLAKDMAARHAQEDPADVDNKAREALVLASISNVTNAMGDVPTAIALEERAWDTAQPVLQGPRSRRWMQVSTYCFFHAAYQSLNNQFNTADPESALVWIDRAEGLLIDLGKNKPEFLSRPLYISQLANVRLVKADILRMLHRNAEARVLFEDAMRSVDAQSGKDSVEVAKHQHDVHSEYAEFLLDQGDLAGATAASTILRPVRTKEMDTPGMTWDRINYSSDTSWWAALSMHQGHTAEAMENVRLSLEATRFMLGQNLEDTTPLAQHVGHLVRFGELPGMDPAAAQSMFTEAIPLAADFTRKHPAVLSSQILEAHAHLGLARLALKAHNATDQRREAGLALDLLGPVVQQRPRLIEAKDLMEAARTLAA